jgi:LysM repeat protein
MTLLLSDYKRPPKDNGRGIHGIATTGWSGGDKGLDYWLAELEALGIKWMKVVDANCDSLPLCRKLVSAGMFPVVRLLRYDPPPNDTPEPNPGHINAADEETVRKLIDVGVLYFETNNEPDLGAQWKNAAIPTDLEEAAKLVALNWLFDARFILEAGGYPGLPAVSSGSKMNIVDALVSLGRQDILPEGCWIAIHNFALNRPLDFPSDAVNQTGAPLSPDQYDFGPFTNWVWWNIEEGKADTRDQVNQVRAGEKKAGSTVFQDHTCFREHEYYAALVQKCLGRPIPILGTAGGYSVGRRDDHRYPRTSPQIHADLTTAMFDYMQLTAPDYLFACMPSLLVASPGTQMEAWFGDFWHRTFQSGPRSQSHLPPFAITDAKIGPNLPVVAAVKAMPNFPRGARLQIPQLSVPGNVQPPPPPPPPNEESLYLVRPGDPLADIAAKFDVAVPSLMAVNRISDSARLIPGQKVIIPAGAAPQSLPPKTTAIPLAAKSAYSAPTPPKPRGWGQFDLRLVALNVRVLNAMVPAGYPYWKLVRAEYHDSGQSDDHHYVSYSVLDEKGAPLAGQRVFQGLAEDRTETSTDSSGTAQMPISTTYSPQRGETGPYSAWVDGLPSDRVTGLGLPVNLQVDFNLVWQKTLR